MSAVKVMICCWIFASELQEKLEHFKGKVTFLNLITCNGALASATASSLPATVHANASSFVTYIPTYEYRSTLSSTALVHLASECVRFCVHVCGYVCET